MAILIDENSEINQATSYGMSSDNYTKVAQAFTADGTVLSSVKFYLKKTGAPTDNAVVNIYAITGTFGLNATPTGSSLATSANLDVSTLTTSYALVEIAFTGSNQIILTNGVNYFISLEYAGGVFATDRMDVGASVVSTHPGNLAAFVVSWTALAADLCFYVYGLANVFGNYEPYIHVGSGMGRSERAT